MHGDMVKHLRRLDHDNAPTPISQFVSDVPTSILDGKTVKNLKGFLFCEQRWDNKLIVERALKIIAKFQRCFKESKKL